MPGVGLQMLHTGRFNHDCGQVMKLGSRGVATLCRQAGSALILQGQLSVSLTDKIAVQVAKDMRASFGDYRQILNQPSCIEQTVQEAGKEKLPEIGSVGVRQVCLLMGFVATSIGLSRPSGVWVRQKREAEGEVIEGKRFTRDRK